ncbi:winged helix family two component transcriptional regulator [Breoghania corrubedonensis]|uniref:Winged helix family two component transcriptional regulator n=1 Tax=Breoghania corrubedonensis TaxID=665038 RepID=A0A2T5V7I3_9HYPH|nr:response regulator transcription factor [Breoghania corrubedonensis]PTW59722.1 winged helix family two component transcriptional regulator [Breoghania corrubedonensis]
MRILLVEDDRRIATDIEDILKEAGFTVEHAADGNEAWFLGDTEEYAGVVLDLGLPGLDGLTILKRWRANGRSFPILVLTARGAWMERVEGIEAGADDYLAKPFQMEELLARLRAIIRRAAGHATANLYLGDLVLDPKHKQVSLKGRALNLPPQEYRLLAYFMHHQDRVVTHTELIEHLYGPDADCDENTIAVMIGRLRRKIGADRIRTRRGFGYIAETPARQTH